MIFILRFFLFSGVITPDRGAYYFSQATMTEIPFGITVSILCVKDVPHCRLTSNDQGLISVSASESAEKRKGGGDDGDGDDGYDRRA